MPKPISAIRSSIDRFRCGAGKRSQSKNILLLALICLVAPPLITGLVIGFAVLIGKSILGWSVGESILAGLVLLFILASLLGLIERIDDWWRNERWNRIKIAAWIMLPILFGSLWLAMGEFTPALLISLAAFALLWTIGHVHYKYKAFKEWTERRRLRKEAKLTENR